MKELTNSQTTVLAIIEEQKITTGAEIVKFATKVDSNYKSFFRPERVYADITKLMKVKYICDASAHEKAWRYGDTSNPVMLTEEGKRYLEGMHAMLSGVLA